jgi:hypothetical protein
LAALTVRSSANRKDDVMAGSSRSWIVLPIASAIGLFFAWVDSRPTWDDAGVMVLAILMVSGMFGAVFPRRAWLWALGVGIWIPLWSIVNTGDYKTGLVLVFAFLGAYAGAALRLLFRSSPA